LLRKYFFKRKRAFMLLEILVAMAVLAFGITSIFRILFGSMAALKHLENRFQAQLKIEEKIWDIKRTLKTKDISNEFLSNVVEGHNPEIDFKLRVKKIRDFPDLYSLDITASWNEERKEVSISKQLYIKRL